MAKHPKVHLQLQHMWGTRAACGQWPIPVLAITHFLEEVSCGRCRRNPEFKRRLRAGQQASERELHAK